MRIYTVSTMFDMHNEGVDTSVVRSYRTFDGAVDGCTDLIMERLSTCGEFREALAMDEDHAESLAGFIESLDESLDDHYPEILDPIAVRTYVHDWLKGGGFSVWNDIDGYNFYIEENDLVD